MLRQHTRRSVRQGTHPQADIDSAPRTTPRSRCCIGWPAAEPPEYDQHRHGPPDCAETRGDRMAGPQPRRTDQHHQGHPGCLRRGHTSLDRAEAAPRGACWSMRITGCRELRGSYLSPRASALQQWIDHDHVQVWPSGCQTLAERQAEGGNTGRPRWSPTQVGRYLRCAIRGARLKCAGVDQHLISSKNYAAHTAPPARRAGESARPTAFGLISLDSLE
jgi:hypothetical protein